MGIYMISDRQFNFCRNCSGEGEKEKNICPTCLGTGIWAKTDNKIIFFKREISRLIIAILKIKKFFKFFFKFILTLFGLFGFICLCQAIFSFSFLAKFLNIFNQPKGFLMLIFWLSLAGDIFLVYLKERAKEKKDLLSFFAKGEKINVNDFLDKSSHLVIENAFLLARKLNHRKIEPTHLFIGILQQEEGAIVFSRLGLSFGILKERLIQALSNLLPNYEKKEIIFSMETKKILIESLFSAVEKKKRLISPLEILFHLASEVETIKSILDDFELKPNDVKNVIIWKEVYQEISRDWQKLSRGASIRPKGPMNIAMTAVATPFLDNFSQDLTYLARIGYLAPFMDREKEMEEIFRILESGKGNLVLVGPPGIGKTAIIEGLARKMIQNEVPKILQDKRLVSLSLAKLVAGASAPGEIEQRLQIIIQEIIRAGNIVLFIKDIHNMIGVKTTEGELDISEILAEAIEKKYFLVLATSIPGAYERYLESSSLGQALTKINIDEPDKNNTILILEAKVAGIEAKNKVFFSYGALEKAIELSERYLYEKFLPEKAISLLEEVAVYTRQKRGINNFVLKEDVAEIVSQKTGIPSEKVSEEEKEKLLVLEKKIHEKIIDQEEAVNLVSSAIRRARTELRDPKKPIVNLLFLGPTGVGKTELAKTVAEIYFGKEERMIRLDMSEFQTKESLGRLIGNPAEPRGVLTEAVRRAPFSLLLLDEIEKSHPDILNVFLQVMDDGRLTDWQGRTINFTNLIIIGTSNAGTDYIQKELALGKRIEEIRETLVKEKISNYFRPEFLNRFDAIVVFKPLGKKEIKEITKLLLKKLSAQLEQKGVIFQATEEAIEELADLGFDQTFGARYLKRVVQEQVNNALATYLLTGKLAHGDVAILEKGGIIRVEKKK